MTFDKNLSQYMSKVYAYMMAGILVTISAVVLSLATGLSALLIATPLIGWVIILLPFVLIFVIEYNKNQNNFPVVVSSYVGITAAMGIMLSLFIMKYSMIAILTAFTGAAAGFIACSLYGTVTKRDLSAIGSMALFALVGLIVFTILASIFHMSGLVIIISLLGLAIFAILTAWDTQQIRSNFYLHDGSTSQAISDSLMIYLDFLNIFLYLLRLIGNSND